MLNAATVAVKSAWYSKVNWIAAATGLSAAIAEFTPLFPDPLAGKISATCAFVGAIAIWYTKTFQTTTITPSSASKL